MNLVDPENFRRASTFIHVAQGAAFFVLGAAESYAADNKVRKLGFVPPAAFILAAVLMLCAAVYFLGGWRMEPLLAALALRGGFYVFIAAAWFLAAAGMTRLMALCMGERGGIWQFFFLAFLGVLGLLCFLVPYRVEEAARPGALIAHVPIGMALLAAVFFKGVHFFFEKKVFQLTWAVLLLIAAGQLLVYREDPRAFEYHKVTIRSSSGPDLPAVKKSASKKALNAEPADKKRPADRSRR